MSAGEWFTLNPLNLKNYQSEIDDLTSRVTNVETTLAQLDNQVQGMVIQILNLQDQVLANTTTIQSLNNQISQINSNVSSITNTVNSMNTNISNILNLYQPNSSFTVSNVNFTDYHGNNGTGSLHGGWYQPIILQPSNITNDGVDLKFLLLVIRGINITNIAVNGNYFYSDPFPLPIPFVNNNNLHVFW
jgi:hypothetical protein